MTKLTGQQIAAEKLDGWAYLAGSLRTRITTPDFATGLALVNAIGAAAEEMNHHPDVDLRYTTVAVRLTSHDTGGVTSRDIRLAHRIDDLATAAGLATSRTEVAHLEVGLDTPDQSAIAGFWTAVLAGTRDGDDIRDPREVLPLLWFQHSGSEEPRQRWHYDLWLDPAQVQPRIDAALAAGGTLVSDENAPAFWVLADAEGNRMCICTWQDRAH